jgi:hypothetical protein
MSQGACLAGFDYSVDIPPNDEYRNKLRKEAPKPIISAIAILLRSALRPIWQLK